eukprot:TRINITY_DN1730_c0_g1_i1.p1 TRINITY_DN1730_c0_g1~~TRINITY_DN1730_c0_g1_i1.p1  ORF type:complete len:353 (-),score=104.92 TRINITY_DN1730_c0_g1_i1:676-1734(-)
MSPREQDWASSRASTDGSVASEHTPRRTPWVVRCVKAGFLGVGRCILSQLPCLRLCTPPRNYKKRPETVRELFLRVAMLAPSVVVCRCSPTQKAEIVTAVRTADPTQRVCAIGDGGNDVAMIQAAHVGIGVFGKEGKQAALAADFAVTQFHHIKRLFFWHGRNAYKRSCRLAAFIMHRGLIISVLQAVFSALFYGVTVSLFSGWLTVGYSTAFTMLPVFALILSYDTPAAWAMRCPEMYKVLRKGRALNVRSFLQWTAYATYQGGAIMLGTMLALPESFLRIISIAYTALIFTELLMVVSAMRKGSLVFVLVVALSLVVYVVSMFVLSETFDLEYIFYDPETVPRFWLSSVA